HGRARRGGLRIGTHRQTVARRRAARDPVGHHRRARHAPCDRGGAVNRGAAWLLVLGGVAASAACGPRRVSTTGPSTVVLLAEPDGSVGRAVVTSAAGAGEVDLAADRAVTTVTGRQAPSPAA